ncbi:MAG: ATP-dependent DNA helicase RecG, partial [Planctomycetota bacterium]
MRAEAPSIELTSPIESVPGVGPKTGEHFRALGIPSVAHLVHYLPFRHEREEAEDEIEQLAEGHLSSARGEVMKTRLVRSRRPSFQAVLMDESGRLDLIWFNQMWLNDRILPGMRLRVQGKARKRGPALEMVNPQWEELEAGSGEPELREQRLRPVYSASAELPSKKIEKAVEAVLDSVLTRIEDHWNATYRKARELPELGDAYRMMHRPESESDVAEARRRLAYDELLLLQAGLQMRRARREHLFHAPIMRVDDEVDRRIRSRLPFALTPGQDAVVGEIRTDLAQTKPAYRLIQGDVGSGKTAVAVYAMLAAVATGHQAALLAPTEILAEQHGLSLGRMLEGASVRTEVLTGSTATADRRAIEERLASGEIDLIIGTHALLSEQVKFASLGVAVIDEQHRFGVKQRAVLREKSEDPKSTPHVFVMTATPIPRTLALSVFGDLDVSILKGRPPGRREVTTRWVKPEKADEVWAFVRERVERGEQAFVVQPTIDGAVTGGDRELGGVTEAMERLQSGLLKGVRLAQMHGRMSREERESVMTRFREGTIDVLISTTVIEVGVDVPGATMIVIEHADRFGLAQLHQLRGRVGRGEKAGVCVLIADPVTVEGSERLKALVDTIDGFELAEKDLELRGPGEMLGLRQSGELPL